MMNLPDLIRCKRFPTSIKFTLLDIARHGNVIEDLLDFINEHVIDMEMKERLEKEVELLELKLDTEKELNFNLRMGLDKLQDRNKVRETTFDEFVKATKQTEDRYPSIDEAWKTAWESCIKALKSGEIHI